MFLRDVARIVDGPPPPEHYLWYGTTGSKAAEYPAVTLSVTKKPGENAVDVTARLRARIAELHNSLIPEGVGVEISRDYGATANNKALKLIEKLLFATASVVALVFFAMGRREAAIVGIVVALTLTATLFASWAWGFTLNRVSLFALMFSIGILVDDAIVVVENIHRHLQLAHARLERDHSGGRGRSRRPDYPRYAHGDRGAVADGLRQRANRPLHGADPDQRFNGHADIPGGSLRAATVAGAPVVEAEQRRWYRRCAHQLGSAPRAAVSQTVHAVPGCGERPAPATETVGWSCGSDSAGDHAAGDAVGRAEDADLRQQVGIPGAARHACRNATRAHGSDAGRGGALPREQPEVRNYQVYAGLSAPINFNGLVRQYHLRSGGALGDIQVNLVDKHARSEQSHAIAERLRPQLAAIAQRHGAVVKVVEVPPGPPVQAPIVAEIYGPDDAGRLQLAQAVRTAFLQQPSLVEVDASYVTAAPRDIVTVDRARAARLGVNAAEVVASLRAALTGIDATFLEDASKYPAPLRLSLPDSTRGSLDAALSLGVRAANGSLVPLTAVVNVAHSTVEQPRYHEDLLPLVCVTGDVAGKIDSPLYGMFGLRSAVDRIVAPDGGGVQEYFIRQPSDPYRGYTLKWDGEWQITYETFRDMGAAYAVGLILIYLLVVAQFGSYPTPLIIMAPIPLTIIGVMPGHALLRSQFTATSMIGMIALAGIIVRNSILLVDFIRLQLAAGADFRDAVVRSAATRAQPIVLTALAAMLGALFILDDPIFNGLAISLIFGILVSTVLTLVVIPLLYYAVYRHAPSALLAPEPSTQEQSS